MSSSEEGSDSGSEEKSPLVKKKKTSKPVDEEARLRQKLLKKKLAAEDAIRKKEETEKKKAVKRQVVMVDDNEDDILPIRPPQPQIVIDKHRKHHRHRRSSEDQHRTNRDQKRSRHSPEANREQRAQEGWARWKHSIGRPSSDDRRRPMNRGDREHRGPSHHDERAGRSGHQQQSASRSPLRRAKSPGSKGWIQKRRTSPKDTKSYRVKDDKGDRQKTVEEAEMSPVPISEDKTPTQDEMEDQNAIDNKTDNSEQRNRTNSRSSVSSSTESGELSGVESDKEIEQEDTKDDNKKNKYSKFESSEESDSESDDHHSENEKVNTEQVTSVVVDDTQDDDQPSTIDKQIDDEVEDISKDGDDHEEDVEEIVEEELPVYYPGISGCRSVEEFHCLNRIEEGTYGVVYRAKEKRTDEIVALKRLKMEKEKEGFPITSLREINMLLRAGRHPNIVNVREIVVGSNMDKIYLVMDYVEHDMKCLMESMKQPFLVGEVKTLMQQLLAGVHHLHDNWILHRDLKTSNLLFSHRGILKIGDFGLAREYGSPLKPYTAVVVTLWYRAPELLLGIKEYSTFIDMWSVGCIFAEFLQLKPLFPGKGEIDQINRIFKLLGTPNMDIWPGYNELPAVKKMSFAVHPYNHLRKHFGATLSDNGFQLLNRLLTYNPQRRITASEALDHLWFSEEPRPVHPDMFPTWPAKSEQGIRPPKKSSPKPPSGGKQFEKPETDLVDEKIMAALKVKPNQAFKAGFNLKFDAPKF